MTAIVTGRESLIEAKKACAAQFEVVLAVSYWGKDAADDLELQDRENVRIVLNVAHGGTNPEELATLMQRFQGRVRVHPTLHAKIYASRERALIGSANASSNGLQGGHAEAGVVLTGEAAQQAFTQAEEFYKAGKLATQEDVATCKARFGRGTIGETMQPKAPANKTVLDTIQHRQDRFGNLPLLITDSTVSDEYIRKNYKLQQQAGAQELVGNYNHKIWDYFDWSLNERYHGQICLSIHRSSANGSFFLYLVQPVNHVSDDDTGTFGYLLDWSAIQVTGQGWHSKRRRILKSQADWEPFNKAFEALNADFEGDWSEWHRTGWDLYEKL